MLSPRLHVPLRCATDGCAGNARVSGLCKECYDRERRGSSWTQKMRAAQVAAANRKAHEAKLAADDAARARRQLARDPRVKLCRIERRRKTTRDAKLIAEAKVEYQAMLAAQERVGRGGRPKGRGILVRTDPADVLIRALEGGR